MATSTRSNLEDTNICAAHEIEFTSASVDETMDLGRRIGERLEANDVVALAGPLGAGKTVLTKGIASGLGVADTRGVRSPTFVLISEYAGRLRLYHVDAYRLHGAEDIEALGADEFMNSGGVTVIEWADRVADALPRRCLWITGRHVDVRHRRYQLSAESGHALTLVKALEGEG
jgi:tRNA threonylcarbamoyladenosine biosynthesis protein TsaE